MKSTFQINLAPSDYRICRHLLKHQVETWRGQVDEILVVIDTRKSFGRFGDDWQKGEVELTEIIRSIDSPMRVVQVDYSASAMKSVSARWTGGKAIPIKDFRGGPCYAYFFGMDASEGEWILHSDADMFFGGRSPTWLDEAKEFYSKSQEILFLGPHSGMPASPQSQRSLPCQPDFRLKNGCVFDFMSTRLFLLNKDRFKSRVNQFVPTRPGLRERIKAIVEGNPPWDLPEHWMTAAMKKQNMIRYEFSGEGSGMWSLHPPYRCQDFFDRLPELVQNVECGNLPEPQRGIHDLNDCLVDWSEATAALKSNRWWRRLLHRVRAVFTK